jgi:DnaJ-class molecular chaperone
VKPEQATMIATVSELLATCPHCKGSGRHALVADVYCISCNGAGKVTAKFAADWKRLLASISATSS